MRISHKYFITVNKSFLKIKMKLLNWNGLKWKIAISVHIPKIVMNIMSDTFLGLGPNKLNLGFACFSF